MKKSSLLYFIIVMPGVLFYTACRKTDRHAEREFLSSGEARFFNEHVPANGLVNTARQFVMSQNEKYRFVKTLIDKLGYPYWDKAIVKESEPVANRGDSETEGIVFIPFVPENDNTVKATLAVSIHPQDTSFRIIQNWQHRERIHGSMTNDSTAENVTALFMLLHKEVFGHKRFHITDPALFADLAVPPNRTGREIVIHDSPGEAGRLSSQTILYCFYGYVCGTPSNPACTGPNGCDYLNCPTGQCEATSTCVEFEVEEETGGGGPAGSGGGGTGGGGPAGGGGGGTGGGWIPPDNPCVPTQANNNCGQGWVPVELGEGGPSTPPNDSTITANLKKLMLKAKDTADHLHYMAQQDGKERVFTFNRIPDTVIVWKKIGSSHTSSPTLDMNSFAICHTHQEDDPIGGSDKNQCFDGPDIFKLYQNYLDGYSVDVSIITTRDYYYAAVIIDPILFKSYMRQLCRSQHRDVIKVSLHNLHTDAMDNCTCTWQKKTEMGVLAITSNNNSATSGIRIFRSPRTIINFTLLTQ